MSSDDGIHIVETLDGYEIRLWQGEGEGSVVATRDDLKEAVQCAQQFHTEYGMSFSFLTPTRVRMSLPPKESQ